LLEYRVASADAVTGTGEWSRICLFTREALGCTRPVPPVASRRAGAKFCIGHGHGHGEANGAGAGRFLELAGPASNVTCDQCLRIQLKLKHTSTQCTRGRHRQATGPHAWRVGFNPASSSVSAGESDAAGGRSPCAAPAKSTPWPTWMFAFCVLFYTTGLGSERDPRQRGRHRRHSVGFDPMGPLLVTSPLEESQRLLVAEQQPQPQRYGALGELRLRRLILPPPSRCLHAHS